MCLWNIYLFGTLQYWYILWIFCIAPLICTFFFFAFAVILPKSRLSNFSYFSRNILKNLLLSSKLKSLTFQVYYIIVKTVKHEKQTVETLIFCYNNLIINLFLLISTRLHLLTSLYRAKKQIEILSSFPQV